MLAFLNPNLNVNSEFDAVSLLNRDDVSNQMLNTKSITSQ